MMSNSSSTVSYRDGKNDLTIPGSLRSLISDETAGRCARAFGDKLRAVVLTGSLARGEESVEVEPHFRRVLGDAEFLLIFRNGAKLPGSASIRQLREEVEQALKRHRIKCKIDLSAVLPAYLRHLPKHIFTFELRSKGRVIWGDATVLSTIPAFDVKQILREDAWRMLSNRLIELLEVSDFETEQCSDQSVYRVIKLYLDTATSFLVFAGAYAPSYREREENLRILSERAEPIKAWAMDLVDFSAKITACTNWKLSERGTHVPPVRISWQEAIRVAHQVWRWELRELTQSSDVTLDSELMQRWMHQQPITSRSRGWLYVLRNRGWHRSWREWLRWGRLALHASPRYCVYHAASQLAFMLPMIAENGSNDQEQTQILQLAAWLPIRCDFRNSDASSSWQRLTFGVVWNYHTFLEKTRA